MPAGPVTATTATARPDPTPLLADGDTLGVVGMGVMGCTILKGLLAAGALPPDRVWGTSRSADTCREVAADLGVAVEPDVQDRLPAAGVVVLCVKPAQAPAALAALAAAGLRPDALIVSIAAGVDSTQLSTMLGTANPIVRAMPNTPCVVGEGMTAICGGPRATPTHLAQARRIFECVGRAVETEEKHFNAITALSGSGPAYHYLIMEAMADAGVRVGLPRDLALALVSQTTLGSARMVQTSGRHPAALRDDVTTPAGCTIGGLLMLEDGKIRSVLARAIEEATRIASKLGPAGPAKPAGDPH
jgi:pyrroline-5-carboxylate reductase